MNRIVFLGSGGGGYTMSTQERRTGGLFFELKANDARSASSEREQTRFIVDPGPGCLVFANALGLEPAKWNGVLISNQHVDHAGDANAVMDGMKNFFLVAEEHCLRYKKGGDYPVVSRYHQGIAKHVYAVRAGDKVKTGPLEISAVKAWHYAPAVGFVFDFHGLRIGYTSDGSYYSGMEKSYEGCAVLIANAVIPKGDNAPGFHMSIGDLITLLKGMKAKPRLVVLRHFGGSMLRSNLYKQEKICRDATGVSVISASDFMQLDLETLKTAQLKPKL